MSTLLCRTPWTEVRKKRHSPRHIRQSSIESPMDSTVHLWKGLFPCWSKTIYGNVFSICCQKRHLCSELIIHSATGEKTYSVLFGKYPSLKHDRLFGYESFVLKIPKESEFKVRAVQGVYLATPDHSVYMILVTYDDVLPYILWSLAMWSLTNESFLGIRLLRTSWKIRLILMTPWHYWSWRILILEHLRQWRVCTNFFEWHYSGEKCFPRWDRWWYA